MPDLNATIELSGMMLQVGQAAGQHIVWTADTTSWIAPGPGAAMWFNTKDYTWPLLIVFMASAVGWLIAYGSVVHIIVRDKFVQIPAIAVMGNLAWEFVWSFCFKNPLGVVPRLGYDLWFLVDVFIFIGLWRYGVKQISTPLIARHFRAITVFGVLAWGFGIYFLVSLGYDLGYGAMGIDRGYGALSGYILNLMMSTLFITQILKPTSDPKHFTLLVAYGKMFGTAFATLFNIMAQLDNTLLLAAGIVVFILDWVFIALVHHFRNPANAAKRADTTGFTVASGGFLDWR